MKLFSILTNVKQVIGFQSQISEYLKLKYLKLACEINFDSCEVAGIVSS